ncbi:uncharacterized protein LOC132627118 [Lycium barbarum]|uniref:uncharacterized protein LOC132627118 n=1 Tax=Lycium barbarum TaxID=112863 RepID=UPI00293E03F6|nr:uncharacterized protein LOC132627118 [Lycium barbarum]
MAPSKWPGAFNTSFQFFIGLDVVTANCINYGTSKLTWGWRLSLGLAIVLAATMTIGALLILFFFFFLFFKYNGGVKVNLRTPQLFSQVPATPSSINIGYFCPLKFSHMKRNRLSLITGPLLLSSKCFNFLALEPGLHFISLTRFEPLSSIIYISFYYHNLDTGALLISDTPSSLFERGKLEQAKQSVRGTTSNTEIEAELADLIKSCEITRASKLEPFCDNL